MSVTGSSGGALPAGSRMRAVSLAHAADFAGWRTAARRLLHDGVAPESVSWCVAGGTADMFAADCDGGDDVATRRVASGATVPKRFLDIAERVVCHRDTRRYALLYRILWRLTTESKALLDDLADADTARLYALEKAVRRDCHKMRAFVRFRRREVEIGPTRHDFYLAWFEPEHHIVRYNSDFFRRRFASLCWSIVTPDESVHWNRDRLQFGPALDRETLPGEEPMEDLWRSYFSSIFNPARLRIDAMRAEMPMKYWKNLPEAELIAPLVEGAGPRAQRMVEAPCTTAPRYASRAEAGWTGSATRWRASESRNTGPAASRRASPVDPASVTTLASLADAMRACQRCDVACRATQAVPGDGSVERGVMLVGEQPGDREDLRGRPFVGPAGRLLRALLEELGVAPASCYLTNAVKHFDYEVRGKLRLHRRPAAATIERCRPFLFREIELIRPHTVVALGATAARAITGRTLKIASERGRTLGGPLGSRLIVTAHPSSVLRVRDAMAQSEARERLRRDLALALDTKPGPVDEAGLSASR